MSAAVYNAEIGENGSFSVVVEVLENDGMAANLTGYTGSLQVRINPDDAATVASGTVTISSNVVTGVITSSALAADTTWMAAYYDMRIVNGTNE